MKTRKLLCGALAVAGMLLASVAAASSYSFYRITANADENVGSQLLMDVTQDGSNAAFTFYNNVGIASSITDIYFDYGANGGLFSGFVVGSDSGAGVAFASPASPSDLPGGNTIGFNSTYSADSDTPISQNGINAAGEWLTFLGTIGSGFDFNSVLASLASGDLRVGLHVQSIGARSESDGYVNVGTVPLPAAAWLFGSALLGFVMLSNRRRV